jgi:DNA-binding response OmpR family regulator
MIPKLNGFAVRENMLADSSLKQTPYILLSHQKDEATIRQSIDMRIIYYLQKPYILTELLGLAESILMDQN